MKTLNNLCGLLFLVFVMTGCFLFDKKKDVVTPSGEDYQKIINDKYKALGWTDGPDNGGKAVQTVGKKGWVQYYGSKNKAIYYYPSEGSYSGGAFGFYGYESKRYDEAGQETFAPLGRPIGDGKLLSSSTAYSEFEKGGMIGFGVMVYGEIYKKYKALGLWDGVLGYPVGEEVDLGSKKGRYQHFSKNGLGKPYTAQIYYSAATGAQAFWGKIDKLYSATGYDGGWLGLPTTSCDPNIAEGKQYVRFQNGAIDGANCGNYYGTGGLIRYQNGSSPTGGAVPPCYY